MNKNLFHCRNCSGSRRAITLIEVVVGLTLLGGLLAATLVASSHHLRQLRHAESKQQAVDVLDRFMAAWARSGYREAEAVRIGQSQGISVRVDGENATTATRPRDSEEAVLVFIGEPESCPLPGANARRVEAFVSTAEKAVTSVDVVTREEP